MAGGAHWRRGARGAAWSVVATALLVGLTVASAPPVGAAGADWPQFRGGADHRGWNRNETIISAANVARLHPAWIASVLQYPPVEPVVAGNRLYVASYNEATFQLTIKAKNPATGATLWTQSVRSDPLVDIAGEVHNVDPRLAVSGGRLFVASSDAVYAFDAASGRLLWRQEALFSVSGITVDGGALIALVQTDTDDVIYAFMVFDAASGRLRGATSQGDGTCCLVKGPATAGGISYVDAHGLVAFTGQARPLQGFSTPAFARYAGQPAAAGGLVYVMQGWEQPTTANFNLVAADSRTGAVRWKRTLVDRPEFAGSGLPGSNLAVDADRVYVHYQNEGDRVATLAAFNRWTGARVWSLPSPGDGAPTVANGVVFVAERDRGVAAYRAGTGAELWRHPGIADGTDPIVANGRLYVGLRPAGSSGPANLSMFEL